mmetsp:Transcript_29611/g.44685  ORF Transcript_29611/g.44685 Transcript_29611/m.44685 type:complete len:306 (+) Transcript_29611:127-1044(+)
MAAADLFAGKGDKFGGLTIELDPQRHGRLDPSDFAMKLAEALTKWSAEGKRGLWLKVPSQVANLIDPAIMNGFEFHHAQPGYVMMTKWLPATPSGLPVYPHHQVGVGGMVLDSTGTKVLCIQERAGMTAGMKDFWKLPGGLVDAQEDLSDAAMREVREETGIQTVFDCIATVRESHSGPFGCCDLYMVCILKLSEKAYGVQSASSTPPMPTPQESEIAACEWRDLTSFLNSKYYAKGLYGSLLRTAADVALRRAGHAPLKESQGSYGGKSGKVPLGMGVTKMKGLAGKPESMYFGGAGALTQAKL